MRCQGFNYSQKYSPYQYKELFVPADGAQKLGWARDKLHLWPRHNSMLIAFPNTDGSFTSSLFAKKDLFSTLTDKNAVEALFKKEFPDAMAVMPTLKEDFINHPTGALLEAVCFPYHFEDKFVLLGDSAHSMVPFMGQGTNAAFEDCALIIAHLEKHGHSGFEKYSLARKPAADAICEVARKNAENLATMENSFSRKARQA